MSDRDLGVIITVVLLLAVTVWIMIIHQDWQTIADCFKQINVLECKLDESNKKLELLNLKQ